MKLDYNNVDKNHLNYRSGTMMDMAVDVKERVWYLFSIISSLSIWIPSPYPKSTQTNHSTNLFILEKVQMHCIGYKKKKSLKVMNPNDFQQVLWTKTINFKYRNQNNILILKKFEYRPIVEFIELGW